MACSLRALAVSGTSATCPDCAALQEVARLGGHSAHARQFMGALRHLRFMRLWTCLHLCPPGCCLLPFPFPALPGASELFVSIPFPLSILSLLPPRSVGLCPDSTSFAMNVLSFPQAPRVRTSPPPCGEFYGAHRSLRPLPLSSVSYDICLHWEPHHTMLCFLLSTDKQIVKNSRRNSTLFPQIRALSAVLPPSGCAELSSAVISSLPVEGPADNGFSRSPSSECLSMSDHFTFPLKDMLLGTDFRVDSPFLLAFENIPLPSGLQGFS